MKTKSEILTDIIRKLDNSRDESLELAQWAFKGLTPEEMQQHEPSGETRQATLDYYKDGRAAHDERIACLNEILATCNTPAPEQPDRNPLSLTAEQKATEAFRLLQEVRKELGIHGVQIDADRYDWTTKFSLYKAFGLRIVSGVGKTFAEAKAALDAAKDPDDPAVKRAALLAQLTALDAQPAKT